MRSFNRKVAFLLATITGFGLNASNLVPKAMNNDVNIKTMQKLQKLKEKKAKERAMQEEVNFIKSNWGIYDFTFGKGYSDKESSRKIYHIKSLSGKERILVENPKYSENYNWKNVNSRAPVPTYYRDENNIMVNYKGSYNISDDDDINRTQLRALGAKTILKVPKEYFEKIPLHPVVKFIEENRNKMGLTKCAPDEVNVVSCWAGIMDKDGNVIGFDENENKIVLVNPKEAKDDGIIYEFSNENDKMELPKNENISFEKFRSFFRKNDEKEDQNDLDNQVKNDDKEFDNDEEKIIHEGLDIHNVDGEGRQENVQVQIPAPYNAPNNDMNPQGIVDGQNNALTSKFILGLGLPVGVLSTLLMKSSESSENQLLNGDDF